MQEFIEVTTYSFCVNSENWTESSTRKSTKNRSLLCTITSIPLFTYPNFILIIAIKVINMRQFQLKYITS